MKKLLFLGPLPEPTTGQSLACKVLLDDLVKDYEVEVVNLNKRSLKGGAESIGQILMTLRNVLRVAKGRRGADIIYFTISESFLGNLKDIAIYTVLLGKLSKTIVHLHGGAGMTLIMKNKYPLLAQINRLFLRRLAGVIVLGDRLKPIYSDFLPADRLHVAKNFAEASVFLPHERIAAKFAGPTPLRLLFLSNLIPGKGHLELAAAFQRLSAGLRATMSLDFAGKFESQNQERVFLDLISDTPQIVYRGVVSGSAKVKLLADAHVLILPTYYAYEGQPISILEAYASGAVVVTTDHSGIFDTFAPDINGFVVEKRSIEDLVRVLNHISDNRGALGAIALENAREAADQYQVPQHIAQVRRAITRAIPS